MRTKPAMLWLLMLALPGAAAARAHTLIASKYLVDLYSNACVATAGDPAAVGKYLDRQGVAPLGASEAEPFLKGAHGKVWPAAAPFGSYAIAARDDGICSVFARKANAGEVRGLFEKFVEGHDVAPPFRLVKAADKEIRNGEIVTQYMRYQYGIPGQPGSFLFSLATSESPGSPLQAIATFVRTTESMPADKTPAREKTKPQVTP